MKVGIISGSFFYDFPELEDQREITVATLYGEASITAGRIKDIEVFHINRHGTGHKFISHQINHRANILALRELQVGCIIATTVVGVVQPDIDLGELFVFEDLHFPENRLPTGEICTVFNETGRKGRGHLIFGLPFSQSLREAILESIRSLGLKCYDKTIYGHVNGPRFNSRSEISLLRLNSVSAVSQTAGPEAILSAELEIPYQLIGFGSDYANGVRNIRTPVEELNSNLSRSKLIFKKVILETLINLKEIKFDQGFVYRFE